MLHPLFGVAFRAPCAHWSALTWTGLLGNPTAHTDKVPGPAAQSLMAWASLWSPGLYSGAFCFLHERFSLCICFPTPFRDQCPGWPFHYCSSDPSLRMQVCICIPLEASGFNFQSLTSYFCEGGHRCPQPPGAEVGDKEATQRTGPLT